MSGKSVKLSRKLINKMFSASELKFQKRFLFQCMNYNFLERFRLCKIILFRQRKKIKGE
jgi:hypothetical protein